MTARRDIVDIPGVNPAPPPPTPPPAPSAHENAPNPRPFLGVWFKCCHVYGRMYKSADGASYAGRCPKCGSPVGARVGKGGTTRRFFEAS